MSPDQTLGTSLGDARARLGLSLKEVAERAGCSPAYVQKLESDRVRSPSPRVLSGLAEALGVPYADLMQAAGYGPQAAGEDPAPAGAVKRFSNAHIVELIEKLQGDIDEIKKALANS